MKLSDIPYLIDLDNNKEYLINKLDKYHGSIVADIYDHNVIKMTEHIMDKKYRKKIYRLISRTEGFDEFVVFRGASGVTPGYAWRFDIVNNLEVMEVMGDGKKPKRKVNLRRKKK